MKNYPIQSSFEFGQISWKFGSRYDLGIFGRGLSICENMITDPRGPCETRGSFDNLAAMTGIDNAQAFGFAYTKSEVYVVVFSNLKIDVFNADTGVNVYSAASPYIAAQMGEIHGKQQDGNKTMYFAHDQHAPQELVFTPPSTWILQPIVFTAAPVEWAVGNYPSTVTFGQGRSWWAGCPNNPQTIFGSRSYTVAGYADMTTGALATDGFKFNITQEGKVEWISNAKNMQIGTDNAEHILTAAGLVVKTGDISHAEQSGYGSAPVQPYKLGLETLYLSPDGKKIRSMWFTEEQDYVSQDITYTADGEFPALIKKFTLMKKPDMLIWCVLEDGSFASCTYFKEASEMAIIGWHFHSLGDGLVKDMTTVEKGSETLLISLVHRNVNGTDFIMVEKYNRDTLLDAREVETHGSPADTITGKTNLAGKTVQVLVDDTVHGDVTLDASGNGTIDFDASKIEIGFSFHQKMKTMPYITSSAVGTDASWKKRPSQIIVRVHESQYPLINGVRPPDRRGDDLMDTAVPPYTGDIKSHNRGYDEFGQVTIEQDLPLKLRVTAILGDMGKSSL